MKTLKQTENYLRNKIKNTDDAEEQDTYYLSLDWLHCAQNMKEFIAGLRNDDDMTDFDKKITKQIINYVGF